MRRVVALALLTVTTAWPSATPASAEERCETELPGLGVALLGAPRSLADDPRAGSSIIDELNPGATIERRIRFSNGDPSDPLPIDLSPVAATVEDGEFRVGDGRATNELTGWTSLSADHLVIPACDHVEITATIAVPGDAAGGERYALIAAEHRPAPGTDQVTVASRIGIRAYLHVAGEASAREDLEVDTLTPGRDDAGRPVVDIGIGNPGDRALDLGGELELRDGPGGTHAGPFPVGQVHTLGPGQRAQVRVTLDPDLPDGPWRAQVTMRSGELERRAEAVITFPDSGLGEAVDAHPLQRRSVLIPIALGLLALALLLLWLVWWRRRRDEDEDIGDGVERVETAAPELLVVP